MLALTRCSAAGKARGSVRPTFCAIGDVVKSSTPIRAGANAWSNLDFRRLWIGETLAQTGGQISVIALPLLAVVILDAGPSAVALLTSAQHIPIILVSLFAGRLVDHYPVRVLLSACHLPRAVLIGCIPLAYVTGVLNTWFLIAIAFAVGSFSAVFDVAYLSYAPRLVTRDQVESANTRVEWTYTIADAAGPGIGGFLVQAFGAPFAPLVNTATYVVSLALGWRIEPMRTHPRTPISGWRGTVGDALSGVRMIWRHPVLRLLVVQTGAFNLLGLVTYTFFLVFGVQSLHLPAVALGWILASANIGAFLGACGAIALGRRFGVRRTLVWSIVAGTVSPALVPAAGGPTPLMVFILATGFTCHGLGLGVFNVHALNIRVDCVPPEYMGRVVGAWRLISWAAVPCNGMVAAVLALFVGARWVIFGYAAVFSIICLTLIASRLARYPGGLSADRSAVGGIPDPGKPRVNDDR